MKKNQKYKLLLSFFSFIIIFLPNGNGAVAEEARVIITWEANNFFPSFYQGRAYATAYSETVLSAQLLNENNIFLDLSGIEILWYADNRLISRGVGSENILFQPTKTPGDSHLINAVVRRPGKKQIQSAITLPVLRPQVAADLPHPGRIVPAGSNVGLSIIPFFFNVNFLSDLEFFWKIRGVEQRKVGINTLTLDVLSPATPGGEKVEIEIAARNTRTMTETARERSYLIIR